MTTANDLITRAARALGYLGRTSVLSAADANDGLTCLNNMLDSWSNEKLVSYTTLQRSFSLVIGQQTYTIGSGGNINSTRPYDIVGAFVRDTNNIDYHMSIIPRDKWDNIGEKQITSQIPDTLFYDPQYPLGVINIFPIPLLGYTVYFNSTLDQVDLTTLSTAMSMPVGYELAYWSNLALVLKANGFPCLLSPQDLADLKELAKESKGNIKRANIKEVIADYDDSIVSKSYATYNVYSDSSGSRS